MSIIGAGMGLQFESLAKIVSEGFARAAITTSEGLQDDDRVRAAARNIYDVIPFPLNMAIKMSVGVEGLERFALSFRDQLVAANVTDLAKIRPEDYVRFLRNGLSAVPGLNKFVSMPASAENEPGVVAVTAAPATVSAPRSWYITRDGQQFGPWTDADFLAHLHSGTLVATDKVWLEGLHEWIDLAALPNHFADKKSQSI